MESLIRKLEGMSINNHFDCYIKDATFPNFKNIVPSTRISFDFPITFLVGGNGSGKSSILHALWGMPFRYSTSRFWFSTAVDPIEEGGEFGINQYWYTHWCKQLGRDLQTRKVRGRRRSDYWEPARALKSEGMDDLPVIISPETKDFRSKDRWNPVKREVIYLNFKCEFSAFDKFFYFATGLTNEERQDSIKRSAEKLKRVISSGRQTYKPGGKEAVFENRKLTRDELDAVSYILGREYVEATYVMHRLYGNMEAPSVIFKRKELVYSEAFAGSGELAVVRAVIEILRCKDKTLVLLDEPETSLHPGAQKRLLKFLLDQTIKKKLQVVASTHSPTLIENMPPKAIKAMEESISGRMQPVEVTHPQVAFNRLGHIERDKVVVAVEDDLLCALVEVAMIDLDPGEREAIKLYVPPAGASDIFKSLIPNCMYEERAIFFVVDGDQELSVSLDELDDLGAPALKQLYDAVKQDLECTPSYIENDPCRQKEYLSWIRDRVHFLDSICPELVLLRCLIGDDEANDIAKTNQQAKDALKNYFISSHLSHDAASLRFLAKLELGKVKNDNPSIIHLRETLRDIMRKQMLL
ncbi:MAG: AAA family ATPase [Pseudomonas stutzeri]|nr:AAA family ATPase [Stutzerimonas stutzeri]NIM57275.1 AAA family ATPase [Stutzerimonas stutzeri]NIM86559.1 AAA family ATPase [Stutzerimonas stutzeri]NIN81161.1 AAA family ATPase [Stutzerimonas stutzeri]NIP00407.1 AAA family ATPase [Stutzerimonas stutzeri]